MTQENTAIVAVVRDANGNVKFDDFDNIPTIYHPVLTEADWTYIATQRTT